MARTTDATEKLGAEEGLRLASEASEVIVARGKKVQRFNMKKDRPDDDTLLAHMLGPTGNLRAPVLKKGQKLLVGFNEDLYEEVL